MTSSQRPQHVLPSNPQEKKQEDSSKEKEDCSINAASIKNDQSFDEKTTKKSSEVFEFSGDTLNGKCITSCLTFLCKKLTVDEVVVHLRENYILTPHEANLIREAKSRLEKNQILIDFVQQRGPEAFSCFMESLTETGQKFIFDRLIEERKKITERENLRLPKPSRVDSSTSKLFSIQSSWRKIYLQSYRNVLPFSLPFLFDIERKWVNLTLKLESDSTVTNDYVDLLKKAFAKVGMLIIEGDPGVGKSSLMHRLAYEWTQSRLNDYDLVLHIEFRKLREYECKDIKELVTHYMKGSLNEQDYEMFHNFINDTKYCEEHKILVLLDGYDESSLEKQCQELSDYFSRTASKPLLFNVLITSRKGYLSKLRNQERFIFADIIGFTTEPQRQEYISKHFNATNDTEASENTVAVAHLLNTNTNLKRLSESPLMLTFICLTHKKIVDGTEVELYMNIIWWMIDKYQKSNSNRDVPSLFDFKHDGKSKISLTIENNYQHFPQLHLLGIMAMQDIFKTTFEEAELRKYQLKAIVQEVGLIRNELTRDTSSHTKVMFSFVHRTIQEFIIALTFFFSDKISDNFLWYVILMARNKNYGIIPTKIETFLKIIYSNKKKINEAKKKSYLKLMDFSSKFYSDQSSKQDAGCTSTVHFQGDIIDIISKHGRIPRTSEEAIEMLHYEAIQGDVYAQFNLGIMYNYGIIIIQSDEEAIKWYRKSAEQGNTDAQFNLGFTEEKGKGVPQSAKEAVIRYTRSTEQGNTHAQINLKEIPKKEQGLLDYFKRKHWNGKKAAEQGDAGGQVNLRLANANGRGVLQSSKEAVQWYKKAANGDATGQNHLGCMYEMGKGVPQSYKEAVKWFKKAAEQGDAAAQSNLGFMSANGRGVPQSDEEALNWFRKAAEQGDPAAQNNLGAMYAKGRGVLQSDDEAVNWFRKAAEQKNAVGQSNLGIMYERGRGVPQSDKEAVLLYRKAAEQGEARGQSHLGFMYERGRGGPQSEEEAVKWYKKAAEQGYAGGQNHLGCMYEMGKGVPQSYKEAVKWFKKAAEQGDAAAQSNLGIMYAYGRGVSQSYEEAAKWYRKTADQGDAEGKSNLGCMYEMGKGVPQSYEEAVKWYRKAAEQGDATAQNNLGAMYANGRGVLQSDEEAVDWLRKAAEQGYAAAQNNLLALYETGRVRCASI